ncbi:uncharacterized protein PHACADRAFT_202645 [Phanerochaete carnosa HHB-10118-sp]|uniref:Uncharacterized protein n=1 Tax=Phanerochaete carnosa (strain HHB-10118-sp) TaxID=650164 RepID=K5VBU7_PHACS|nr:uncharacterized protein PHACADRAFT_202645 [Phanerochaete carnosa HHB-10118-sp]EKM48578.1 hypothetical protein PHACADRAFT_202645 [Phanerochaete carnosa HHB-10118-sp]
MVKKEKKQEESHTDQSQLNRLTEQSEGEANTSLSARIEASFYLEAPEDISNNSTREEENTGNDIPLAA